MRQHVNRPRSAGPPETEGDVMFVRQKTVNGLTYYQLVESYRKDGKVRQRVLWHMGQDATTDAHLRTLKRKVAYWCGSRTEAEFTMPCQFEAKNKLDIFAAILAGKEPPARLSRGDLYRLAGRL
jgi:hypothetical protein